MSRRDSGGEEEALILEFELLLSEQKSALELVSTQGLLEDVKNYSSKFTQLIMLASHRNVLYDLIDIALNPGQYQTSHGQPLTTQLTYRAIEILSSLSEQFVQTVFGEVGKSEGEVVQSSTDYPILQYILKVLFQQGALETSLAYLVKLITPFIYQRAEKMLVVLNGKVSRGLVNYFWNKSICELVGKALEAEGQHDFYEPLKLSLVKTICEGIALESNQLRMEGLLQSFAQFLEGLVQKHQDRYQKQKFNSLIREIVARADLFEFTLSLLQKYPHNNAIKRDALHCIETYLRIHLPVKQKSDLKISNGSESEVNKSIKVSESFLTSLTACLSQLNARNFLSQIRLQIVYYYKLLKILITVQPQLAKSILTKQLLVETLQLLLDDPDNNILHNYQKDVLVEGIKHSTEVYHLLKEEVGLQLILRDNLTAKASKKGYQMQLFLIGQAIELKTKELQSPSNSWSDIEDTLKHKREFYATLIGGDPRNFNDDRWSNCEGEVMEVEVVQVRQHNQLLSNKVPFSCTPKLDELGGTQVLSEDGDADEQREKKNDHYFDSQLPLDSDKEEDKIVSRQSLEFSSNENIIIRINSFSQQFNSSPPAMKLAGSQKSGQQKPMLFVSEEMEIEEIESPTFAPAPERQQPVLSLPNQETERKTELQQSAVEILFGSQTQSLVFESGSLMNTFSEQPESGSISNPRQSQQMKQSLFESQTISIAAAEQIEARIKAKYGLPLRTP